MSQAKARHCTAVIPAHNEALTIRDVVLATRAHVDAVLVVDDGSTDGTAALLADTDSRVVRYAQNRGKGACLPEAFELAFKDGTDAVITLDADGQHDPADIPRFRRAADAAPDALVLGDRSADRSNMPPSRARWISFGNVFIGWACATRIADAQCGMRVYPASAWRLVRDRVPKRDRAHFVFESAVLMHAAEAGVRFVPVAIAARYAGHVKRPSHYRPVRDGLRIARAVTTFLVTRGLRPRGALITLGLIR